ncbi:hypothetical protein DFJ68_1691 [Terracoccus luteus]|jgi:hypothetical protein|uniref:MucB/RseB-like sigma(E) regulatory protein n=1 Tax=Terracoccus luteus TaxID=53356 RepID=A0A495XUL8_9MICO|nr:transcriptional regulator [Terracoccus luteus]RKT78251.1 hypothetical protein DFJ68_1691 [Terracoccus luteus]
MERAWRWGVVAAVVAALVALPSAVGAWPAGQGEPDAGRLLERVRAASGSPYEGLAETTGALGLPVTDGLADVASLLGGRTQQRVWWRSADDWRSDVLTPTGEESTRETATGRVVWDYEANRAVVGDGVGSGGTAGGRGSPGTASVRLPRAADTLPPSLAARLLSDATAGQVGTLPSAFVAGRAADGLRLTPGEPLGSVDRVDVWADRASGVAVRVEVYGRGADRPALASTFLDFSDARPASATTAFTPPPGARVRQAVDTGLSDLLGSSYGWTRGGELPERLAGFARVTSTGGLERVGEYGRGVTRFAVALLPDPQASSLRRQLLAVPGARRLEGGVAVTVGPVGLFLGASSGSGESPVITGTLTPEGLARAAAELADRVASS